MLAATLLAFIGGVAATNIFVTSYAGNITTLSLTETNGTYDLTPVYTTDKCSPNPAWLTLDTAHGILYCLGEGLNIPNGTLNSFLAYDNGTLTHIEQQKIPTGGVASTIYGNAATGKRGLVTAHYNGSAMTNWALDAQNPGSFSNIQNDFFYMNHSGPNAARQASPHEHDAVLDPTGSFIVMPDLGADLVRVFSIDPDTLELTAESPLEVVPGSGPRHAVFYQPYGAQCKGCTSFMFVVTELTSTVTSYAVSYPAGGAGMSFEKIYETTAYGNMTLPSGNAAAEISISPDNRFLVVSNRNNTSFEIPNPDPANATKIASDSLSTFKLNLDGTLDFVQLAPCGGSYPRQYSMNKYGDLVAVGLQYGNAVVILQRDTATGLIGSEVARHYVEGQVNSAWWQE
ncbi:3-carboxy-cis,cis-mucoante lactonizing enzyme [Coleophoma crateriformis]|uniref:3-carboxy-cis,cis-mucoante lactonizing enzyme n=1 Tax=Coleophoma crateriformis TaxID=565419 RepID=A0A3D8QU08_9HELO|nr:3-carboxy-cis,cis-mucoante lactonizing enzyme [Coleophoma crateriformis]